MDRDFIEIDGRFLIRKDHIFSVEVKHYEIGDILNGITSSLVLKVKDFDEIWIDYKDGTNGAEVEYKRIRAELKEEFPGIDSDDERLEMSVYELDLTQRAANCLVAENILSVGELINKTQMDLLKVPNLGRNSLKIIKEALAKIGLSLKK